MALFESLVGGALGLLGASSQASAARQAAQSNLEAAKIAAEAQKFRPVGVTTRFGTSQFTFNPQTGNLESAGYVVSPEVAALRDRLLSEAGTSGLGFGQRGMEAAGGLFNLGQQYIAQSPQEAAQQWMASQQALLTPSRERALAQTRQGLFNTGRSGLSIAQGGNLQATNPELAAYYNAVAQQDALLASQATEQGRAQTKFGAGLFGTGLDIATAGYNPLKTQFGLGQTLEEAGQNALNLGINIGGRATTAAGNAADTIYRATTAANQATAYSPWADTLMGVAGNRQLTSGLGNWLSGLNRPTNPMGLGSINPVSGEYMGSLEF